MLQGLTIKSKDAAKRALEVPGCVKSSDRVTLEAPGGYKFHIVDEAVSGKMILFHREIFECLRHLICGIVFGVS